MRHLSIIALCGALAACSQWPTSPSTVSGFAGSSSERVSTLGGPPSSQIGPGAGTGTLPTLGAPNSCPEDRPLVSVNGNNGKHDFSVTKIAGLTKGYEWEIERNNANVYRFHARLFSDAGDGRAGLYAQPETLGTGQYRVRARALRRGCGVRELGTWSDWQPFSVDGPQDNPEPPPVEDVAPVVLVVPVPPVEPPMEPVAIAPCVEVYLGQNRWGCESA